MRSPRDVEVGSGLSCMNIVCWLKKLTINRGSLGFCSIHTIAKSKKQTFFGWWFVTVMQLFHLSNDFFCIYICHKWTFSVILSKVHKYKLSVHEINFLTMKHLCSFAPWPCFDFSHDFSHVLTCFDHVLTTGFDFSVLSFTNSVYRMCCKI